MWGAIIALFPTIAGWINLIIGFFQQKAADQKAADGAEQTAVAQHQNDGAQSVVDQQSQDAQDAALDQIKLELEKKRARDLQPPQGSKG